MLDALVKADRKKVKDRPSETIPRALLQALEKDREKYRNQRDLLPIDFQFARSFLENCYSQSKEFFQVLTQINAMSGEDLEKWVTFLISKIEQASITMKFKSPEREFILPLEESIKKMWGFFKQNTPSITSLFMQILTNIVSSLFTPTSFAQDEAPQNISHALLKKFLHEYQRLNTPEKQQELNEILNLAILPFIEALGKEQKKIEEIKSADDLARFFKDHANDFFLQIRPKKCVFTLNSSLFNIKMVWDEKENFSQIQDEMELHVDKKLFDHISESNYSRYIYNRTSFLLQIFLDTIKHYYSTPDLFSIIKFKQLSQNSNYTRRQPAITEEVYVRLILKGKNLPYQEKNSFETTWLYCLRLFQQYQEHFEILSFRNNETWDVTYDIRTDTK